MGDGLRPDGDQRQLSAFGQLLHQRGEFLSQTVTHDRHHVGGLTLSAATYRLYSLLCRAGYRQRHR